MTDPKPRDGDVESYPDERDGARLIGRSAGGGMAYYHPDDNLLLETDLGPDELRADSSGWTSRRALPPGESVGDLVGRLQRSLGLSELTEYARSQLPGVSDDDSEETDADGR
ncbi:hypothetical protein SAMN04487948_103261 [Halogranum amylolyticum]|uniref:Uncharacterized protein n=1 Tax=Halogranum amylolyticum TaxID=660520 RepID=A0A1H8QRF7_9EURY|nr:hypothetical protein [Halogranum amylolyticum]SEO56616.1 hypothetical protein SAMN04487948_103261 [Halogranum amylolyticum]